MTVILEFRIKRRKLLVSFINCNIHQNFTAICPSKHLVTPSPKKHRRSGKHLFWTACISCLCTSYLSLNSRYCLRWKCWRILNNDQFTFVSKDREMWVSWLTDNFHWARRGIHHRLAAWDWNRLHNKHHKRYKAPHNSSYLRFTGTTITDFISRSNFDDCSDMAKWISLRVHMIKWRDTHCVPGSVILEGTSSEWKTWQFEKRTIFVEHSSLLEMCGKNCGRELFGLRPHWKLVIHEFSFNFTNLKCNWKKNKYSAHNKC